MVLKSHMTLGRLWCVIELFVFLEMGGSLQNLEAQNCKKDVLRTAKRRTGNAHCRSTQFRTKEVIILPDPENRIADRILDFDPCNLQCNSKEETAASRHNSFRGEHEVNTMNSFIFRAGISQDRNMIFQDLLTRSYKVCILL